MLGGGRRRGMRVRVKTDEGTRGWGN